MRGLQTLTRTRTLALTLALALTLTLTLTLAPRPDQVRGLQTGKADCGSVEDACAALGERLEAVGRQLAPLPPTVGSNSSTLQQLLARFDMLEPRGDKTCAQLAETQAALQKLAKELLETRAQSAAQQQQVRVRVSANPNPSPSPNPNPNPNPNPDPSPNPSPCPNPSPSPCPNPNPNPNPNRAPDQVKAYALRDAGLWRHTNPH